MAKALERLVAFTGQAGSGKTTAANFLVDLHRFNRVRFAGPLKNMMRTLGLSEREIDGDLKELPCELLGGKAPRWAMQSIGTEWGRNCIDVNLWIRAWQRQVQDVGGKIVVDDCRYPNEADIVRTHGGTVIHIIRPGHEGSSSGAGHSSEKFEFKPDLVLINDGTRERFLDDVWLAVEQRQFKLAV